MSTVPQPGITTTGKIKRVIDGDTLEVTITKTVRIRLLSCYCPEVHGIQKENGIEARNYCQKLIDNSDPKVRISIPTNDDGNVQDILTLNRVLGDIWLKNSDGEWENLSKKLVNAGHATPTKS